MCASIEAATGRIVACNSTLAAATGYTSEELLAMPHISHLYDPDVTLSLNHDQSSLYQEWGK